MRIFPSLAILAALFLVSSAARSESEPVPVVALKRAGLTASSGSVANVRIDLKRTLYGVFAEKDGHLLVEEGGVKAWVEKSNCVPISEAIEYFTKQLQSDPQNGDLYARRAETHLHLNAFEKAKQDANEVIRLNPKSAPAWDLRARVHSNLRELEQSAKDIERAIELDPKDPRFPLHRGWMKFFAGDAEEALASVAATLQLDPRDLSAFALRAQVWFFIKRDPKQALVPASEVIKLEPKSAEAYDFRGALFVSLEDFEKARADFETALKLNAAAPRYMNLAGVLMMSDQFDQARSCLDSAAKLDASFADVFAMRGKCHLELGDEKAALVDFEKALKLDAKNITALVGRGNTLRRRQEYANALMHFEQATQIDPDNASVRFCLADLRATCPDADIRDGLKAVVAARRGCELSNWGDHFGFLCLAAAYAESGDFESAVIWQEKAMANKAVMKKRGDEAKQMLESFRKKTPWRTR